MKRKELMAALLASAAANPPRVFDPDCMIRIPDCHSIIEVLRLIKHGGPEWASRYVSMWFDGASNGWALVYPLQETSEPYFDFMYTGDLAPQKAFSDLLAKYPQCGVMDWSVGRIACVIVEGGRLRCWQRLFGRLLKLPGGRAWRLLMFRMRRWGGRDQSFKGGAGRLSIF